MKKCAPGRGASAERNYSVTILRTRIASLSVILGLAFLLTACH